MKWALLTLTEKTSLSKYFLLFLCVFFSIHSLVFSLEPTTGNEEELGLYTKAREQEEKMAAQYITDGMRGFSKKLDKAIQKDTDLLAKFFGEWYCDGCDSVISPDFDQAMIDYLNTVAALTKSTPYDFSSVVKPYLDPSISKVSNTDIWALNTLINIMSDSIIDQIREQMILSQEITTMGRYYDWDINNSHYDLMADIRKVDSKYFNEAPELWPYQNTSLTDMASLISGMELISGQWWSSWIDADIAKAIGTSIVWSIKWIASATTSGSCSGDSCSVKANIHTIEFPLNKSFTPEKWPFQLDTFQSIFEKWNEWIIKYGINRNNSCKIPPTWFFFQGLFDPNASLADMFSMWVYPVQEVPELLKWFMNRESRTREFEDTEIDKSVARVFKERWLDYDRPTEILIAWIERSVNQLSRKNADNNVAASTTVDSLERWEDEYQKYIQSLGTAFSGTFIKEHSAESMDHIGIALEEIESRAQTVNNFSETLNTISDYLLSKGECQPS